MKVRERKEGRRVEMRGGRTAPSLHSPAFALSHSNRMGLGRSPIFNAHGARRTSANLQSRGDGLRLKCDIERKYEDKNLVGRI